MVVNVACALQLGPTPETALLAIASWVGFYAGTLEEFYTGELYLGYINMPNEGLLLSSLIHLSGALFPPAFWTAPVAALGGLRRNQCMVVLTCVASLITAICNGVKIFWAVAAKRRLEREAARSRSQKLTVKQLQESSHWVAATRSVPTVLIFGAFGVWLLVSPSDILGRRPRLVLWAMGITNSKLATGIMLSHICDQEYHPWCRTIACLCTLLVHLFTQIWRHRYGTQPLDQPSEDLLLYEAFWIVFLSCAACATRRPPPAACGLCPLPLPPHLACSEAPSVPCRYRRRFCVAGTATWCTRWSTRCRAPSASTPSPSRASGPTAAWARPRLRSRPRRRPAAGPAHLPESAAREPEAFMKPYDEGIPVSWLR